MCYSAETKFSLVWNGSVRQFTYWVVSNEVRSPREISTINYTPHIPQKFTPRPSPNIHQGRNTLMIESHCLTWRHVDWFANENFSLKIHKLWNFFINKKIMITINPGLIFFFIFIVIYEFSIVSSTSVIRVVWKIIKNMRNIYWNHEDINFKRLSGFFIQNWFLENFIYDWSWRSIFFLKHETIVFICWSTDFVLLLFFLFIFLYHILTLTFQ